MKALFYIIDSVFNVVLFVLGLLAMQTPGRLGPAHYAGAVLVGISTFLFLVEISVFIIDRSLRKNNQDWSDE